MPRMIKTMQLLGYSPEGGVCFGIAMMGSQAIIRDQSQHFVKRINFIKNTSEEKITSLAEPFDREIEKELHEKKIDLYCFFDELTIYQARESMDEKYKAIVPDVQSANNVKNLAGGEKDSPFVYPEVKLNIINLFSYNEFLDLLMKIKDHLDGHSFSIILLHSPKSHATQIGFDAKQKQWVSSNHDFFVSGNDNISDIEKAVKNIFIPYQYSSDHLSHMVVALDILLAEKKESVQEIDLSALKIDDFNIEKLAYPFNQEALSHVIACYESAFRYDDMIALFDKITSFKLSETENVRLLESKRANSLTLFHFLIIRGKADALQGLFKKAQEMKLSDNAQMSILDKKNAMFPSLLILALQYKSEKIMQVVVDAINTIKDEDMRVRLLGAKWTGIPALSIATEKGYNKVALALINAISNIKDDKVRAWLLEAKDNQGASALLIAAKKGYMEIVEILIEALHGIEKKARANLLKAKSNDNSSASLRAASNEHEQILQILINAICDIEEQQPDFFDTKHSIHQN